MVGVDVGFWSFVHATTCCLLVGFRLSIATQRTMTDLPGSRRSIKETRDELGDRASRGPAGSSRGS
jgi:hypothetical protein